MTEMEQGGTKANRVKATHLVGSMIDDYYSRIKEEARSGKLVAWCNGLPIYVLLRGADINLVFAEAYAARAAARHMIWVPLKASEDRGFLPELCSYARAFSGCGHLVKESLHLEQGVDPDTVLMPKPDLYVNCGVGCGTALSWADYLSRLFDIPVFHFDVPRAYSQSDVESNVAYVVQQENEFIRFLEDFTGRPYNWDILYEALAEIKRVSATRRKGFKLCKNRPSPATFFDWAACMGVQSVLVGLPGTARVLEDVVKELEERVANGIGAVEEEKYRLYYDGIMTWHRFSALAKKFASFNACVVAGSYTHMGWYPWPEKLDPERPLESIADTMCSLNITQSHERWTNMIWEECQEYSVDGVVFSDNHTCRQCGGPELNIANRLSRISGIPVTTIPGDMLDEGFYSDAQVNTRVQALLETIEGKRK